MAPNLEGSEILGESNPWPSTEPQAGWRSDSLQYFDDLREIAVVLMSSIACGLDLEHDAINDLCRGRNGTLRLLNYLPQPRQPENLNSNNVPEIVDKQNRWVAGIEHIDTTTLTLLWQTYPGLQIKGRDDVWRNVTPPEGGLSVHCGDLFTQLTSGVINGSIHRVLADGTHRTSVGMFLEPDWATVIQRPNVDEGLSYAEHLLGVFSTRKKVQARRY
jgi:isopenicillin N synthase-like dioxygenase